MNITYGKRFMSVNILLLLLVMECCVTRPAVTAGTLTVMDYFDSGNSDTHKEMKPVAAWTDGKTVLRH